MSCLSRSSFCYLKMLLALLQMFKTCVASFKNDIKIIFVKSHAVGFFFSWCMNNVKTATSLHFCKDRPGKKTCLSGVNMLKKWFVCFIKYCIIVTRYTHMHKKTHFEPIGQDSVEFLFQAVRHSGGNTTKQGHTHIYTQPL